MSDRPEMVLKLTRSLARVARRDPLPLRLCHAVVDVIDATDGAISLGFSTPDRTVLCATSEWAARFEDAQDLVREGPSLDAYRTAKAVTTSTAADQQRRWPGLVDALGHPDPAVVLALPMVPGHAVVGVLTVHHPAPHGLVPALTDVQFLANAVGAAIIGDVPGAGDASPLWSERDRISQATGMVVAQLDLDPPDALAVLRAHAFAEGSTLVDISRRVVAREIDFDASGSEGSA